MLQKTTVVWYKLLSLADPNSVNINHDLKKIHVMIWDNHFTDIYTNSTFCKLDLITNLITIRQKSGCVSAEYFENESDIEFIANVVKKEHLKLELSKLRSSRTVQLEETKQELLRSKKLLDFTERKITAIKKQLTDEPAEYAKSIAAAELEISELAKKIDDKKVTAAPAPEPAPEPVPESASVLADIQAENAALREKLASLSAILG
jgi:hypothetical protein